MAIFIIKHRKQQCYPSPRPLAHWLISLFPSDSSYLVSFSWFCSCSSASLCSALYPRRPPALLRDPLSVPHPGFLPSPTGTRGNKEGNTGEARGRTTSQPLFPLCPRWYLLPYTDTDTHCLVSIRSDSAPSSLNQYVSTRAQDSSHFRFLRRTLFDPVVCLWRWKLIWGFCWEMWRWLGVHGNGRLIAWLVCWFSVSWAGLFFLFVDSGE